ncbi:MAG: DUF305 domain-containing protein [Cyanobacteriota bacterium]|nr:DUF305 domain-containing protein [Cyanobacteriota bacterium]
MNRQSLVLSLLALLTGAALTTGGLLSRRTDAQSSMPMMDHSQMDHSSMGMMQMDLGPADAAFDLRFIDGMIPHHQGAVIMAQEALEKSQRSEIKQLAQAIIDAQEKEIQQMQAWRKAWYPDAPAEAQMWDPGMGHMMAMSSEMMASMRMDQSLGAADDQFDRRFIDAMIPHHEAALVMAKDAQQKSQRPEIKTLAQAILDSQQAEIDQMKAWRKAWYNQ